MNDFNPNWASPPGDTIKDALEEKRISIDHFQKAIGLSKLDVKKLLTGEYIIDLYLAKKLASIFNISVQFWINREKQYRDKVESLKKGRY